MLQKLVKILNAKDVRRYDFMVGPNILYQGVFHQYKVLGYFWTRYDLHNKRIELAIKYRISPRHIKIENTIKD